MSANGHSALATPSRPAGSVAAPHRSDPRSYYGQPVVKEPVWTPEIPLYFFTGGLAGASAGLAWLSELSGEDELARRAWAVSLGAVAVSPALLISDLGKPVRFLNMLRMFKVTSPMSVGSWILSGSGLATTVAAAHAWTGLLRGPARVARPAAALLGLPLSTYTAALVANTAIPVWHSARFTLPFVFAGGAATSAGAAVTIVTPPRRAGAARRLTAIGAAAELVGVQAMEQSLGELGEPYHEGAAGTLSRLGKALTAAGALTVTAWGARRRAAAIAGGAMVLGGALSERWAVYRAGFQSAGKPEYTVGPQRDRIADGETRGASRRAGA